MLNILQTTLDKAKVNFKKYLEDNGKLDLVYKVDELFNLKVINKSLNVILTLNDEYEVFNQELSIDEISSIPEIIEQNTGRLYRDEDDVRIKLVLDDKVVFNQPINLKNINEVNALFRDSKEKIFNEIGYVDIQLIHNDTNELFSTKAKLKDIINLRDILQNKSDEIYNSYTNTVRPRRKENFYGEGEGYDYPTPTVVDLLEGNFIVSEFDEFLADEHGNCLVFE